LGRLAHELQLRGLQRVCRVGPDEAARGVRPRAMRTGARG
jgi:hypothetical protein